MIKEKPPQVDKLFDFIGAHLDAGRYRLSIHAFERQYQREIQLPDILHVLRFGWHEKQKTRFDEVFKKWKYSIRGETLNRSPVRVIIAFDDTEMLVITVMHVL